MQILDFSCGSVVKNPHANAGDVGSIPGLERSPGGEHGNPSQYSCLENIMNRGIWQATVHIGWQGVRQEACTNNSASDINIQVIKKLTVRFLYSAGLNLT